MPGAPTDGPRFRSLIPERQSGTTVTAEQALGDWRSEGGTGLRVVLNMIASLDGRIAVRGRSAPLGSPADRALFHALRAGADAVMAGAGTVRAEGYGPLIRDPGVRALREAQGMAAQPLAVIVSRTLDLEPTLPLLADPGSRVVILTPSSGKLGVTRARVDYVRTASLTAGLAELRASEGTNLILCEGGPSLNGSLAAESLIHELFLTLSPLLVGDVSGGGSLLSGPVPNDALRFGLRMLLEYDSQLYAHYVARG